MAPLEFIRHYSIRCLYHFTDSTNITSIKTSEALLSLRELERREINVTFTSSAASRKVDARTQMDNYVRVAFTHDHPMLFRAKTEGRIQHPVLLEINPTILLHPGAQIADGIAYASSVKLYDVNTATDTLDFDALYTKTEKTAEATQRWLKAKKYELLIPVEIPLQYVLNI